VQLNIKCQRKENRQAGRDQVRVRHYLQELKNKLILYLKHAQHIFTKTHANAVEQYKNPAKRRGGKRQSAEEVATRQHGQLLKINTKSKAING
jgi:cation transport regulator ChaB